MPTMILWTLKGRHSNIANGNVTSRQTARAKYPNLFNGKQWTFFFVRALPDTVPPLRVQYARHTQQFKSTFPKCSTTGLHYFSAGIVIATKRRDISTQAHTKGHTKISPTIIRSDGRIRIVESEEAGRHEKSLFPGEKSRHAKLLEYPLDHH